MGKDLIDPPSRHHIACEEQPYHCHVRLSHCAAFSIDSCQGWFCRG